MNANRFTGVRACVFDAYGTLFDVHSAVGRHSARLPDASGVSTLWRTKQLEYTWLRTLMGRYVDFWQITQDALNFTLDTYDVADAVLRQDLMRAYLELSCYSEVPKVLGELKEKGFRCAILSNGSPDMLNAAVRNSELQDFFDAVISVDALGLYKPDPRVYQMAVDQLDLTPGEIAFQSSNAWDAAGAGAFGFKVAWVNRFGQKVERLGTVADAELEDLRGLPALL
jgi:2-haloacid dehalogenase